MRRGGVGMLAASPTMIGAITVLITIVTVFLAYNANTGLPFVPTYRISVEVPNANTLVPKKKKDSSNSERRPRNSVRKPSPPPSERGRPTSRPIARPRPPNESESERWRWSSGLPRPIRILPIRASPRALDHP